VPHTSAIYASKNEELFDQLSINANHSDIVKFSDLSDESFLIIQQRIERLVADAPTVIAARFASHRKSETPCKMEDEI
jgi:hypothetical protein